MSCIQDLPPINLTGFVGRLDENRDVSNALLGGWRINFAPSRNLEFGFSRVFQFGGDGWIGRHDRIAVRGQKVAVHLSEHGVVVDNDNQTRRHSATIMRDRLRRANPNQNRLELMFGKRRFRL